MHDSRPEPPRSAPPGLAAKLRPASSPAYLLPRPRLVALLDEATAASPLTLVVAPAGAGKTSLLRSWAEGTPVRCVWFSVDEADEDPVRWWQGILAALRPLAPNAVDPCARLLRRPGRVADTVSTLVDALDAEGQGGPEPERAVLVIDDLHLADGDDEVADSVALFLGHLPAWLHVVVASRRDPRLPVHRWMARGQLAELRFPELRFSFDEAREMLTRLAPGLPADTASAVAGRCGGWAASIQMAALAARSAGARGLPYVLGEEGVQQHLASYVWEEILAGEQPEVVDVLMATSIVDRVDPGLAQVLTNRPDAAALLDLAATRGLFVTRRESTGEYEVHQLVREVLLAMMTRLAPDRPARLHGWAAGWYEAHGHTIAALEHWSRAERWRDALRLLAVEAAGLYDGGHESAILRTVAMIPDAVVDDVEALTELAWCHLLIDRRRFVALVERLGQATSQDFTLAARERGRIELLQSVAATLRGHWADGASLARSSLQQLGDGWWLDYLGQFAWNLVGRDIALGERWADDGPEVRRVVRAVSVVLERRMTLEGTRALGEALAGRPVDALRVATGARQAAALSSMTILDTEVSTAEALARLELGETSEARTELLRLVAGRIEAAPHCQLLAHLALARSWSGSGDLAAARRAFGAASELIDTEMPGPGARSWLARTGVALALATDDLDEARGWLAGVRDPFWSGLCGARVAMAEESGTAVDELKTAEPRCVRHRVVADLVAAQVVADPVAAEQALVVAVRVAADHGLVQTVASEGFEVVEAIERLGWTAPEGWLARVRRALTLGAPEFDAVSVETLTEREQDVLRLLPSRLTHREIADELCVSINTLKFHLKVIYRKLGCSSRAEAAEIARSLTSLRRPAQLSSNRRR
ncbi:helix-turn-helix transcriptional regulator [Nocardioides mangrovi]|uniref:LuxR C-terminal-related transcriptional regulator n=1 Tax=Nocardioides mangrovi TaxID=2874580 RepID=A0ABS7U801_9ACTN|nr:LuxR C-terminal-related transcriptional regulator [Nocardioides mangrovi]MBZ5737108.1 LuxR C-terminal-related transcriptional regulator [Nocardioides mangrovi]